MTHVFVFAAYIVTALLLAVPAVLYQQAYIGGKQPKETFQHAAEGLREKPLMTAVFAGSYVLLAVLGLACKPALSHLERIGFLLLWYGVFCIAVVDFRVKKIPNLLLLILFAVRVCWITILFLTVPDAFRSELIPSLLGLAVGGGILLICRLLSRGGLGAGDIKIYAVLGFFLKIPDIMHVMIVSIILSAVTGLLLLLFRKATMRSSMPMAPFILAGLTVYYIFI